MISQPPASMAAIQNEEASEIKRRDLGPEHHLPSSVKEKTYATGQCNHRSPDLTGDVALHLT